MSNGVIWLVALVALPVVVIALSFRRRDVERLRWLSVAAAATMVAVAFAMSSRLRGLSIRTAMLSAIPGGEAILRIDTLSAALLPFAAGGMGAMLAARGIAARVAGPSLQKAFASLIVLVGIAMLADSFV